MDGKTIVEVVDTLIGYTFPTEDGSINKTRITNTEKLKMVAESTVRDLIMLSNYEVDPSNASGMGIKCTADDVLRKIRDDINDVLNMRIINK